jgi:lambda family phage portal protein
LARNNPHAKRGVKTIANHVVGWGIVPKPIPANERAKAVWERWGETTACDADGRNDFYGLQKLITRSVAESGEVLVRRRWRIRPQDADLPLPMQIQVIDTSRNVLLENGGRIVDGVELDVLGRRVAYWLYQEHPGAQLFGTSLASRRVPADGVLHVYYQERPGQVRGMSWLASVILSLKKFDLYADAQLEKQVVAAMLAVIVSDPDGTSLPLGTIDAAHPERDKLQPGAIVQGPPGRDVSVVQPPRTSEYKDFSEVTLRAIAAGIDLTYEALTGDFTNLPFSAARMSRLEHWANVDDWRWQMVIPQFCDPAWRWAMEAAAIKNLIEVVPTAQWTPPPLPMLDPVNEGLAYARNVRASVQSLSEVLRERGYDPNDLLEELSKDLKKLDKLGIISDSDPRKTTQQGMMQMTTEPPEPKDPNASPPTQPAGAPAAGEATPKPGATAKPPTPPPVPPKKGGRA